MELFQYCLRTSRYMTIAKSIHANINVFNSKSVDMTTIGINDYVSAEYAIHLSFSHIGELHKYFFNEYMYVGSLRDLIVFRNIYRTLL
jgi:hypothetical protein